MIYKSSRPGDREFGVKRDPTVFASSDLVTILRLNPATGAGTRATPGDHISLDHELPERRSMKSLTLAFLAVCLAVFLTSSSVGFAGIVVGPEQFVGTPDSSALPAAQTTAATTPLWTGSEWIFTWLDPRAAAGTYTQRLGANGEVLLSPNLRLTMDAPRSLVPFGAGYLLGHEPYGILVLDHELRVTDEWADAPPNLVSNGTTALAWWSDLSRIELISASGRQRLSTWEVTGSAPTAWNVAAATDGNRFLLVWSARGGATTIFWNVIDADGSILFDQPRQVDAISFPVGPSSAAWNGLDFVIGWIGGPDTTHRYGVELFTLDSEGSNGELRNVTLRARLSSQRLQILAPVPGTTLLAWWEWPSESASTLFTRGIVVPPPDTTPTVIDLTEDRSIFGSDGSGRLTAFSLDDSAIRRSTWTGSALVPEDGWIEARQGVRDRDHFLARAGTDMVLWQTAGAGVPDVATGRDGTRRSPRPDRLSWPTRNGLRPCRRQPDESAGLFADDPDGGKPDRYGHLRPYRQDDRCDRSSW